MDENKPTHTYPYTVCEWYTVSNRQPISSDAFLAHFRNLPKHFTIVNEDGDTLTIRLTRLDPDTPTTD